MGYLHISNAHRTSWIWDFKQVYAMEKIHGTSANISFKDQKLGFFPGCVKMETFVALFNQRDMAELLAAYGDDVVVYGEAYGGSVQKNMSKIYGDQIRFVAFEVQMRGVWLNVPEADAVCQKLGIEFVHYRQVPATIEALDAERDADSVQSLRNLGVAGLKGEGIVIRPLTELTDSRGSRLIAKYKRPEFGETKTQHAIGKCQERIAALTQAQEIADEWVTEERLNHVLDQFRGADSEPCVEMTRQVISAMLEDVRREGEGEIIWSKDAERAVCTRAAKIFKESLTLVPAPA